MVRNFVVCLVKYSLLRIENFNLTFVFSKVELGIAPNARCWSKMAPRYLIEVVDWMEWQTQEILREMLDLRFLLRTKEN